VRAEGRRQKGFTTEAQRAQRPGEKREGTRQADEDEAGTINVYPALKRWASLIRRPSPVGTACARGWKYRTGSRIEFVAQMQLAVRLFNLTEKTK